LILRKISKYEATRCQISTQNALHFQFTLGLCPRRLAAFKGATSKGRARKKGEGKGRKGKGEGKGNG